MSIEFLTNCLRCFSAVFAGFPPLLWILSGAVICSLVTIIRELVKFK